MTSNVKDRLTYRQVGVDTDIEVSAVQGMGSWLIQTFTLSDRSRPILGMDFFANVLDIGRNIGIAFSTDGVGSKVLVAQKMRKYNTIGIDCVATNVNDVLCVGAEPISMLDYIAVQQAPDPAISEEIAQGLLTGAQIAKISIPGGETAQLPDIIKGEAGGYGMDLVGTCVGLVDVDKVIVGREIAAGDVIIGLRSSGIHSNGLTLARRVLFERLGYKVDTYVPEVGRVLGEELLEPTRIYVQDVLPLVKSDIAVTGLVNITSDGFLNLTRLYSDVGFKIDSLPEPQAIFKLIQDGGDISNEEMFHVYNMGIGFCVIVRPNDADRALDLLKGQNAEAQRLGSVIPGPERRVLIEPVGLVGMNGRFHSI